MSVDEKKWHVGRRMWQLFWCLAGATLLLTFNNCSRPELYDEFSSGDVSGDETGTSASAFKSSGSSGGSWVPGRILVQPKPGLSDKELDRILKTHGGRTVEKISAINVHIVELPPQASEKAVAALLSKNPHLEFAELDQEVSPELISTNDPYFSNAWHLVKIKATESWAISEGRGIVIAVLDTGVDDTHPDLIGQLVPGWNIYDNNSNSADVYGHGTSVAGSAAAATNNGIGVAAVAGLAKVMPIRISSTTGGATFSNMAKGLTWAADHGARVGNISYQSVSGSSTVQSAAQYMKSKGGITVVAAGNTGVEQAFVPSDTMISVSATTSGDALASWSSYGGYVDVSAPGVSIYTTKNGGGYGGSSGTSFSSPVVSGVIALMMSANPSLSPAALEKILFATAVDLGAVGWDRYYGHGRIDAAAAVAAAAATQTADTTLPSVSITNPSDGATVTGMIVVDVSASDNVGVARVDLLVNGVKFVSDTSSPYGFSVDTTTYADGNLGLTAEAYDTAGNKRAHAIMVKVANAVAPDPTPTPTPSPVDTQAPTVTISNPADGARLNGATIKVQASASDNVGVTRLSLYVDGKLMTTVSGASLSYSWNIKKISSGAHTIEVRAEDAAGNIGRRSVQVTK